MAASPILTTLYHLEFFQVPVTEYTRKWKKQLTRCSKAVRVQDGWCDLEIGRGPECFPPRSSLPSRSHWSQDDSAFLSNISSEEEGTLVFTGPFLWEKLPSCLPFWISLDRSRPYAHPPPLQETKLLYPCRNSPPARKRMLKTSKPLGDIPYHQQKVHEMEERGRVHSMVCGHLGSDLEKLWALEKRQIFFLPSCLWTRARFFQRSGLSKTNGNQDLRLTACNR